MKPFRIYVKLFWVFFKVGFFTFGGGLAMLPLIEREIVTRNRWVGEEEMVDILAVSQSLPGVIALNSALFVGRKLAGFPGVCAAALGTILPAFLSIIAALLLLSGIKDHPVTLKVFGGIRAASAALILVAGIKLAKAAVKGKTGIALAVFSFFLVAVLDVSAVFAVIAGGLTGFAAGVFERRRQK